MPPFRPIVGGCGSPCERISNLVDFYIQPLAKQNESFVKDTTDFCKKIEQIECGEGDILVSADVSALYTVIDHSDGIAACEERLEERSTSEKQRMPTAYIKQLIEMILTSNCFKFGTKFYHQIKGTAMGTPMAPGYANVFMGAVEKAMLDQYEMETGFRPKVWLRFLDDIFMLWQHGPDELTKFQEFMQTFAKRRGMKTDLQFTFEVGTSVPFLDTNVSIRGNNLVTSLYSKKTDAHLYLRRDSCHPPSCTKGLVKGELLRARRICSTEEDFKKAAESMLGYFAERGFEKHDMEKTYTEVSSMKRKEVLEYKGKPKTDRVPFVITFHPRLRKLGNVLHKHYHLLQSNERLKRAFSQPPMVAFRRLKNLRDMLMHSKLRKEEKKEEVTSRCNGARCKCCRMLVETKSFEINGRQHGTMLGGTCKSANLIYAVKCGKCGDKWYVGETSMKLHERMNQHRYSIGRFKRGESIDKSNDTGLSEHFGKEDHDFEKDAHLHILENGNWRSAEERQCRESFYICRYATVEPSGLNKKRGSLGDLYEKVQGKI